MSRRPELEAFAARHGLKFITVAQIVAYRLANERLVRRVAPPMVVLTLNSAFPPSSMMSTVLPPGSAHEYTSFCPLPTPLGVMQGSYRMVRRDLRTITVHHIGAVVLTFPW